MIGGLLGYLCILGIFLGTRMLAAPQVGCPAGWLYIYTCVCYIYAKSNQSIAGCFFYRPLYLYPAYPVRSELLLSMYCYSWVESGPRRGTRE